MEQTGYVSLWLGNFKSYEEFEDYLSISYTEDGDAIPSKFEEEFNIDHYDKDFIETDYFGDEMRELPLILKGCSYEDKIIPRFVETQGKDFSCGFNCIILLYNFHYSNSIANYMSCVKYFGSVRFN